MDGQRAKGRGHGQEPYKRGRNRCNSSTSSKRIRKRDVLNDFRNWVDDFRDTSDASSPEDCNTSSGDFSAMSICSQGIDDIPDSTLDLKITCDNIDLSDNKLCDDVPLDCEVGVLHQFDNNHSVETYQNNYQHINANSDFDRRASDNVESVQDTCEQNDFDSAITDVENLYLLKFDCENCLQCICVTCDVCFHDEMGNCQHCTNCSCGFEDENDIFYDALGDVENLDVEDFEIGEDNFEIGGDNFEIGEDDFEISKDNLETRNSAMLIEDLVNICLKHNVSHQLLADILLFLRKYGVGYLPKCPRTLLKTPLSIKLRNMHPGQYWHNGITKHLKTFYENSGDEVIDITFSCDGIPVSNSSSSQFWALTCSFNNSSEVFVIGLYHGSSKPKDSNDFLKDFVSEVEPLCRDGLLYNSVHIQVNVVCAVCDAPARSFILNTKNFNAYVSCSKCTGEGEMFGRRMAFLEMDAPLRTDESFLKRNQEEYHHGDTLLTKLPGFGCVSCVALDYLHLMLLGIMRKLLFLWRKGPFSVRVGNRDINAISELLISFVGWVPREFNRKPRSLEFLSRFKGTEFRQILLYTGPVAFRKCLSKKSYELFLIFHVVSTIFVSSKFCVKYCDYARQLSRYFVKLFVETVGSQYVSHNIHSFIHMADDVEKFGPVDNFSSFKFENWYQLLKKWLRKGDKPLQQIARRCIEYEVYNAKRQSGKQQIERPHFMWSHCNVPLIEGCVNPQFSACVLHSGQTIVTSSTADCCVLMNSNVVVLVKNIASLFDGRKVFIGFEYLTHENVYEFPCPSSKFNIYCVKDVSPELKMWKIQDVAAKCFRLPMDELSFAVFPLH